MPVIQKSKKKKRVTIREPEGDPIDDIKIDKMWGKFRTQVINDE